MESFSRAGVQKSSLPEEIVQAMISLGLIEVV